MSLELKISQALTRFEPVTESGCWLWGGSITMQGYGQVMIDGKNYKAHRVFYEQIKGSIQDGKQLDHLCRVRCCVNPDHLEPVDNRTNVLRGIGTTAINARKTHCKMGHILAADSVYIQRRHDATMRICRKCANESKRAYKKRKRIERAALRGEGG